MNQDRGDDSRAEPKHEYFDDRAGAVRPKRFVRCQQENENRW